MSPVFCSHSQICSAQWGFLLLLLGMTSLWIILFSYLVLNQWTEIGISCTMSFSTDRQLSQAHMFNESHVHYCCCFGSVGPLLSFIPATCWQPLGHLHRRLLCERLVEAQSCHSLEFITSRFLSEVGHSVRTEAIWGMHVQRCVWGGGVSNT